MSTIVTRAGKGSPLTWNEVDNNFTNLNTDKYQSGNNVSFGTIAGSTVTSSALTSGRVTFASTGGLLADNANLVWDNTNARLGIGTASPTAKLTVNGNQSFAEKTAAYIGVDIATTAGNGGNLTIKAGNGSGSGNTSGNLYVGAGRGSVSAANGFIAFGVAQTTNAVGLDAEYMRLDSSGNLGLGVTPSAWNSAIRAIQINNGVAIESRTNSYSYVGLSANQYINSGGSNIYLGTDYATKYDQATGQHRWFTAPSGTAGNAITFTQAMTLDASGNLLVGTTSTQFCTLFTGAGSVIRNPTTTTNTKILEVAGGTDTSVPTFAVFYNANNTAMNSANSVVKIGLMAATGRSINAAGTINASGADYAEYMTKAGNFTVAKGDVVGINADGKLTNVFADAVSFVVKSTSPSYVGGDVWGTPEALGLLTPEKPSQRQATEEVEAETDADFAVRQTQYEADQSAFDAALEAVRQLVDRIAFAGQVPVNVLGAAAGQYIVPVNDNGAIKGEAVSNPTFEQYQTAVGKVIAIEADGRARIIVKVA